MPAEALAYVFLLLAAQLIYFIHIPQVFAAKVLNFVLPNLTLGAIDPNVVSRNKKEVRMLISFFKSLERRYIAPLLGLCNGAEHLEPNSLLVERGEMPLQPISVPIYINRKFGS